MSNQPTLDLKVLITQSTASVGCMVVALTYSIKRTNCAPQGVDS